MTVAYDASYSINGSGTTSPITRTHTPVGTPRAVIIFAAGDIATEEFTGATYGGVACTEVAASPNALTTGEVGNIACWFLGSGIPTGPQTVAVTHQELAGLKRIWSITLTADSDTEVVDSDNSINTTSQADPSATLSAGGRNVFAAICFSSGHDAPTSITPLTDWVNIAEQDFGTTSVGCYYYSVVGSSDVTAGWTQTAEDAVAIAVAVSEIAASTGRFLSILGAGK